MATTATGLIVPAGTDAFDPQGDMVDLANSMRSRIMVPVANSAARTALVAAISWTPTAGEPLRVWREDLLVEQVTIDGTNWRQRGDFAVDSGIATFPLATASEHTVTPSFAAGRFTQVPIFTHSLVANTAVSGIVVTAYEVTTSGFKLRMVNVAGGSFSSSGRLVHWRATQATSASATS